jgi:hypothetical protein
MRIIGILILALACAFVYAYSPHEDPSYHIGALCVRCHERFVLNNTQISQMFLCMKKPCHDLKPPERFSLHLKEYMCRDCHSAIAGGFDVHTVHRREVNCRVCHLSPLGWNSSIATIPAPARRVRIEGYTIYIPGSGECPYCHKSAEKPERLHDVHAPVLNKSCEGCHGKLHKGDVCIPCHREKAIRNTSGCLKECHTKKPAERAALHLKEYMCRDCHSAIAGGFDVHTVHRREVNCRVCHLSPLGWNSSIATIPAPARRVRIEGYTIYIPGSGECPYCHKSAEKPERLHDVHAPVLNKSCEGCHKKIKEETLKLWGLEKPVEVKKENLFSLIKRKIKGLFNKTVVDMSCDSCHRELVYSFYNNPETQYIAKVHNWAGRADIYFGPNGEIKYDMEFVVNENSSACLLCHPILKANRYTGSHEVYSRKCTNESCHGNWETRGTKIFYDAGYAGLNLSRMEDPHSRGFISREIARGRGGWEMCIACHKIHAKKEFKILGRTILRVP